MNIIELNRSFGFLVHDVARLLGNRYDHRAREIGLTRAQCKALGYLARNEGIHQAGLAELLEIAPITLVRLLDRMEHAGWIERRLDPQDRRARRLYLGERAKPILRDIRRVSAEMRAEAFIGLSPEQQEQLIDLLQHVHANLVQRAPAGNDSEGAPAADEIEPSSPRPSIARKAAS